MRYLGVVVVFVMFACGGKKEPASTGSGSAAPAGSAAPVGSAAPAPDPWASGATDVGSAFTGVRSGGALGLQGGDVAAPSATAKPSCDAACEHRASCGLGDAAGCVGECGQLFDLGIFAEPDLKTYAAAACDRVKQLEPQFQLEASCRKACGHRAECIQSTTIKDCIPDCVALLAATKTAPDAVLGDYLKKDCAAVTADEPSLACLHSCVHVLTCGVSGDLPSCLGFCGEKLKGGATLEQVVEIGKADCEQVKKTIQLPAPPAPATAAPGGGTGHYCTAEATYRVCTKDGSCDNRRNSERRGSMDVEDAKRRALQDCTFNLAHMVMIANINDRASTTQSCQITSCD